MKLVFIYGPIAVGKLTVAKELVKLTNYKLFHNHLTVDLVGSIASIKKLGSNKFFKIAMDLRRIIFKAAAKENINLIYTGCYTRDKINNKNFPDTIKFIKDTLKNIEEHGGKVCFVQLLCDEKELFKRIKHASRKNFDKLRYVKDLKKLLKKQDFFAKIPFRKSLTIDNTNLSAKKVAKKIKDYYKL